MLNDPPFQSGARVRLPPREFLKRLPIRVSHLIFEKESKDKNIPWWMKLKKKLSDASGPCKLPDKRNEPIYFYKTEQEQKLFKCFNTNYYLKKFELPSGAAWVVRFEEHTHFVSFSFHRYFDLDPDSSCTSITDGSARDFLKTLNWNKDDIEALLKSTVIGGNIDLAVVPHRFRRDDLATKLKLDVESHYVTHSQIFGGMAEVLMSFNIDEDQTAKPRPVIIQELWDMSIRAAGEAIQILLEIEAYRVMASRRMPWEGLRATLDSLRYKERYFVEVSEECKKIICKKTNLFIDLFMVEDYLPILTALAEIALKINYETAEHAKQYDIAQAYNNLVLDRLRDLRERRIDQEPTIKTFLNHRLKQIDQTYKAIGHRQNNLARQISQLDGLLRSRMQARQNFSVHCVHFMILVLTVIGVLNYLPGIIENLAGDSGILPPATRTNISLGFLLVLAVVLCTIKIKERKRIKARIKEAAKRVKLAE